MKSTIMRAASLSLCLMICLSSLFACKDGGHGETGTEIGSGAESESLSTSVPRPVLPPEKLPKLGEEMESDAGENLAGYSTAQLTEKWGHPCAELYGDRGFIWQLPNDQDYVIAYFDDEDYVTSMTYFHVILANVLSFDDQTVTLAPVAGEAEASSRESFTIPYSSLSTKAKDKLSEGLTLYVTYDGTFTADGSAANVSRADSTMPLTQFARY